MPSTISIRFLVISVCFITLCSCGSDSQKNPVEEKEILQNALTLERVNPVSLDVGETFHNTASGLGGGEISYTSSNEEIASVDENGIVTAKEVGNTIITATQAADEIYLQATSSYEVKVGFTANAWIGENKTTLDVPTGTEGIQLYRTKNLDCDFINNFNCNAGLLDFLTPGTLTDNLTTLGNKTAYHFTNSNKSKGLNINLPLDELSGKKGASTLSFNNKIWIIGGYDARSDYFRDAHADVWSTVDGINWKLELTEAPFGRLNDARSIIFDDKIWLIGGMLSINRYSEAESLKIWTSNDGVTWDEVENNFPFEEHTKYLFEFDQKLWAVTKNFDDDLINLWSSDKGEQWTKHESNILLEELNSNIIELNGKLIALGLRGDVWYSEDGTEWNKESITVTRLNPDLNHYFPTGDIFKFKNKIFNIDWDTSIVWYSEDGIQWVEFDLINPRFSNLDHGTFFEHKGYFWNISGGHGNDPSSINQVFISSNGLEWSELKHEEAPFQRASNIVSYGDQILLLGGFASYNDTESALDIYSSNNGFNWELVSQKAEFGLRRDFKTVEYLNKLWIFGGTEYLVDTHTSVKRNDIWFSSDGIAWEKSTAVLPVDLTISGHFELITFNEKLWMFFVNDNSESPNNHPVQVWSTNDLSDWTKEAEFNIDSSSRVDITVFNDQLWFQAGEISNLDDWGYGIDNLFYSLDGKTWTKVNTQFPSIPGHRTDLIFMSFNDQLVAIGADRYEHDKPYILVSTNGFDWDVTEELNSNLSARHVGTKYLIKDNQLWVFGESMAGGGGLSGRSIGMNPRPIIWRSSDLDNWERGVKFRVNLFEK